MSGPGPLTRACDLLDIEHSDSSKERLVQEAYAFLLGGGSISLRDWSEMDAEERWAMTSAGRMLMTERAGAILGLFGQTEEDVARSMVEAGLAEADGGAEDEHEADPSGGEA